MYNKYAIGDRVIINAISSYLNGKEATITGVRGKLVFVKFGHLRHVYNIWDVKPSFEPNDLLQKILCEK